MTVPWKNSMADADHWPEGFFYQDGFLQASEANAPCALLERELGWQQYPIVLFGRRMMQPRLTAWCADPGLTYTYSGTRLESACWHPELSRLRARLEARFDCPFNSVLVNAYRDGSDAMGWHSDDEPELGERPRIASVSLGAPRKFRLRRKGEGRSHGYWLEPGSLLLMSGTSQRDWQHSIPRTRKPVSIRINLTFRCLGK